MAVYSYNLACCEISLFLSKSVMHGELQMYNKKPYSQRIMVHVSYHDMYSAGPNHVGLNCKLTLLYANAIQIDMEKNEIIII